MKPDFEKMPRAELKSYILANRDDVEAIRALFSHRSSSGQRFPAPRTQADIEAQTEAIRRRIEGQS